ncbi:MAG: carbohydrate ABC transporter permease [Anaerolineales bacterium]
MLNNPRRHGLAKYVMLAPALILVFATTIYPMANAFWLSFQEWQLTKSKAPNGFVGLDNYVQAFGDRFFINSVIVTVQYTVLSVAMTLVLGLGMALALQRRSFLNTLIRMFLIFPFAVSPALKGFSFRFMLQPDYGVIQVALGKIFPWVADMVWLADPWWAMFWISISEVWGWAPLYALMFIGAMGSIPTDIFDAAKVDGTNNWQLFWRITLPMISPVIIIATLLKIIGSLRIFDQVVTMTGGGPGRATQSINYYIYQTGFRFTNMGYSSALAYLFLIVLAILAYQYISRLYRQEN